MNRIKDFFYDKNDIIVAVIILIAAALVIYIRVDKIMAYPETLLDGKATEQTLQTTAASESTASAANIKSIEIADTPIPATVAKQLEAAGIISSAADFETDLTNYNMADSIQPGTYQIPAGMTHEQIIEIITGKKITP